MSTEGVITALMAPAEKLIEAVSGAIGKAYEPRYVRRMADAKAYELKIISEASRNNSDIPIVYESAGVQIDTSNFEEIVKRVGNRLAYQEITKQLNIEAVIDKAYTELQDEELVSSEPVDNDWMLRFINSIEDISDDEMQNIWGKILAGEIKQPKSCSLRTLEKLKNMSKEEAEIFTRFCQFILINSNNYFIHYQDALFEKYEINYSDILQLEECGLMSSQQLSLIMKITENSGSIHNKKLLGLINENNIINEITLPIYKLTESGKQLYNIINTTQNYEYFLESLKSLQKVNPSLIITVHQINYIACGNINYNKADIFSS